MNLHRALSAGIRAPAAVSASTAFRYMKLTLSALATPSSPFLALTELNFRAGAGVLLVSPTVTFLSGPSAYGTYTFDKLFDDLYNSASQYIVAMSTDPVPFTLTLDLGETIDPTHLSLWGPSFTARWPSDFTLAVSADNTTYNTALVVVGEPAPATYTEKSFLLWQ